jgi:hypothetical protein
MRRMLRARGGGSVSLAETNAFLNAENKVTGYLQPFMDSAGWLHDANVPPDARANIDGVLKNFYADQAEQLKERQVLAVLETPPAKLLEAFEFAAVPDAEWRAVEPNALEKIEAKKQGAQCDEVEVNTRRHLRFLENHAPYHVRRLPHGGVMLATHPYRTLWPLWADAFALLGIRT